MGTHEDKVLGDISAQHSWARQQNSSIRNESRIRKQANKEAEHCWKHGASKKIIRLALCSSTAGLQHYLSRLLESYGLEVVSATTLNAGQLTLLDPARIDALLIDRAENTPPPHDVSRILEHWSGPVIYNDSAITEASLKTGNPDFGRQLAHRINALAAASPATATAINH